MIENNSTNKNNKIKRLGSFLHIKETIYALILIVCASLIVSIFPKEKRFEYEYEKGGTWIYPDLVAPFNFPIEKTEEEIEKDRKEAIAAILPYYRVVPSIYENEIKLYKNDFDLYWSKYDIKTSKNKLYEKGLKILKTCYDKGIIELIANYQHNNFSNVKKDYRINVINNNISKTLNTSDYFTVSESISYITEHIKTNNKDEYMFLYEVLSSHIKPNIIFDLKMTSKEEDMSIGNLSSFYGLIQKGEVIINNGDIITEELWMKLESLRKKYEKSDKTSGTYQAIIIGQFIVVMLGLSMLTIFLYLFRRDIYDDSRKFSLIVLTTFSIFVVFAWVLEMDISVYFTPFCVIPILIRLLFDSRLALSIHILIILIAGFFVPNGFEFVFFNVMAGIVTVYSIKNLVHRSQYLLSAIGILLTYILCYFSMLLINEGSLINFSFKQIYPFIFNVLLSLLAYPTVYIFEKLFGVTSDVTLMELSNTNNKLLRELAVKAPGTFQHSMQVANMSEEVIYKIGGNPLLVRTGALYHDIGKIKAPNFFIENQKRIGNPHDELNYEESASVIIKHVSDGIELCQKHNVPNIIVDFIRTHHGNTRVEYFYQAFIKNYPDRVIDEANFRYQNQLPFSKETGVLMLADSVEAASRTLKTYDTKSISNLVDNIISHKLDQNQLINTNITLQDVETIKTIFKQMLMNIYHVRVEYKGIGNKVNK